MPNDIGYHDLNSDWLRTRWTRPPYKSKKFYKSLEDDELTLVQFQKHQMYLEAIKTGLIINDEWTGDIINWTEPWLRKGVDLEMQIQFRFEFIRMEIIARIADAQGEANRALTQEETGLYLSDFINDSSIQFLDASEISIYKSDIEGISDLEEVDQESTWFAILSEYSSFMVQNVLKKRLPQIWQKPNARAVYYKERNLIVVPTVSIETMPQVCHAAAHYIETLGLNNNVSWLSRNSLALDGALHMIRPGLYALRGPWIDQHDGALRGHSFKWLKENYSDRRFFTKNEIDDTFTGHPTEYFPMIAQRIARRDPVELATIWARCPEQLLFYLSIAAGNFMGKL